MIERVDHLEIWARDLDETVAFYTNVLGFERSRRTLARRPDGTEQEIACVVLGDFMIEFLKASPLAAQAEVAHDALGAKTFALRVDDMEATAAALKAKGVVFSREPRPGTSFDGCGPRYSTPTASPSSCASGAVATATGARRGGPPATPSRCCPRVACPTVLGFDGHRRAM